MTPAVSGTVKMYIDTSDSGGTLKQGSVLLEIGTEGTKPVIDNTSKAASAISSYAFDVTAGTSYVLTPATANYLALGAVYLTTTEEEPEN